MAALPGHDVKLRPAAVEDIPSLVAIEENSFAGDRLSRRSFQYLLTKAHAATVVATAAKRQVGYATVLFHGGTSMARLYSIAVEPAYRGQRIGRRLLAEAEKLARGANCAVLRLEVRSDNAQVIEQYHSAGYREIGRRADYYEDGQSAIRMEKALAGGRALRGLHRVPYYAQTLEFTCGAAGLMMAMKALDPQRRMDRRQELRLWREATLVFMSAGHGGCGPVGLALAARRRGFKATVYVSDDEQLFLDTVRSREKKEVVRLVQADFQEQAKEAKIAVKHRALTHKELIRHLDRGEIPIVLISLYRLYGEKTPHWVVVTGHDERFVYLHDPFVEDEQHKSETDCINVPVAHQEFDRMARFGRVKLRAAVIVGREENKS